jgi:hypothetical protein
MVLSYFPTSKISIDDVVLGFNESRKSIRKKLTGGYKEDNQIIEMGSSTIYQRRDIYQNYNSTASFFFLGYDEGDLLIEVEVHWCNEIKVFDATFSFNDNLESIALKLNGYSPISSQSEGEYFFEELKIVIMDAEKMGGEGDALGYFYCASDVSHLIG